jgi:hypothetical protein
MKPLRPLVYQFPGSKYRVKVLFPDSAAEFRERGDAEGWGLIADSSLAVTWIFPAPRGRWKHIAEVWIPLTSSQNTVIHEAVHAATHNARLMGLRGEIREESVAHHTGEFSQWLLRQWRRKRKLTLLPLDAIVK